MDSYTNEASQVQTDRCNLFPDAHVLRKFRKLNKSWSDLTSAKGRNINKYFFLKKNDTGKTRIVYFWNIETLLYKSYVSYKGIIYAHLGSIPYFQI